MSYDGGHFYLHVYLWPFWLDWELSIRLAICEPRRLLFQVFQIGI